MYDEERVIEVGVSRVIDAFASGNDPLRISHTVQITSFGGSGTTALCANFIEAGVDIQPGPAQFPFKHRREPPTAEQVPEGFRVLYLVGDPRDAVLSVFRRGIQRGHWGALHLVPPSESPAELESLDTFLAAGVDHFELLDHVGGWLDHPPGYPVLFVRYDHLGEVWSTVAEFAGLGPDDPVLEIHPRASDWQSEPPEVRDRIDAMYAPVAELIESLPPARIV